MAAIISYIEQHGYPPTVREISDMVGLKSTSSTQSHLIRMKADGMIETDAPEFSTRAIRVPGYRFVKDENTHLPTKDERIVMSDEDCADCLCRVCARNRNNDSYNHMAEKDGRSCECNCNIGDKLIETEEDCPEFLPDEDN